MRSAIVLVTYAAAIAVGIVLGLWVGGLTHVECPSVLSTGNCLPVHSLSAWESGLVGLAGSAVVVAAGITADTLVRRRHGV